MVKLIERGIYLINGTELTENPEIATSSEEAAKNTIAYGILKEHNASGSMNKLKLKFDALASHDITYVGIVQTARASGLEKFPIPYVLTNCHNSLCAVGGTINEDDHAFGLSAAKKYGGVYVPAHMAVIHQYMREMMSGCGKMILGSDSHTRYGALGTMAVGEGGGELVKQLLGYTYDVDCPEVIAVVLTGKPEKFVGPQDIALAIIGKVFENGFVKNKIMEFVGDGIGNLNVEYRNAIDVMTTETTCLSSVWLTDGKVKEYYESHGRVSEYKEMAPGNAAYYDGAIIVDMSKIKPMIALPFHPSNAYSIDEVTAAPGDFARMVEKEAEKLFKNSGIKFSLTEKIKNGRLTVEQGVIAGCAGGTFDNICDAAGILSGESIGAGEFGLSVYPSSQPTYTALVKNGIVAKLMEAGVIVRSAFCGPCFGAGDIPSAGGLSIRHTTRNFPNREGSKPSEGQIAAVALMDARSIAATAANKGVLTSAEFIDKDFDKPKYYFSKAPYNNRVYFGFNNPSPETQLKFGPNIVDWPEMTHLTDDIILRVASVIHDQVTTTDELIPSGETSSYRSNPLGLAEFTLSRKDPKYVPKAKKTREIEKIRLSGGNAADSCDEFANIISCIKTNYPNANISETSVGSVIYARKPGDGSAREQAASCQKVLGGLANIAHEYATKRYRSNLINWGMLPFIIKEEIPFDTDDFIFIPGIATAITDKKSKIDAFIVNKGFKRFTLEIPEMTDDEREIILSGCLINYYRLKAAH